MQSDSVFIPRERISVLVGKKGNTKKRIEMNAKCKIYVSSSGNITIKSNSPEVLMNVKEVVQAIGTGFSPDGAMLLLKEDFVLEIVDITNYSKSKNRLETMRARIIGGAGKIRKNIERRTETVMSIYGKTISIIGTSDNAFLARRAVELLLEGSQHGSVFRWLASQQSL
tara:strand:+ start:123 stop:629 length:507 start_codon:yes stop_codon:yes gene_type:complete